MQALHFVPSLVHRASRRIAISNTRHLHVRTTPVSGLIETDNLTDEQLVRYLKYTAWRDTKCPSPQKSDIPDWQEHIERRSISPYAYDPKSHIWAAVDKSSGSLSRGSALALVTWNVKMDDLGCGARAMCALSHLRDIFGAEPNRFVVMLQEVRKEALVAILEDSWVQRDFVVSNMEAPKSIPWYIESGTIVLYFEKWRAEHYKTLMMVSRGLPISNVFRVPLLTRMGRDALELDLPSETSFGGQQEVFRLCTAHLESWAGRNYRLLPLKALSRILKGEGDSDVRVIGGIVGGGMNPMKNDEYDFPKAVRSRPQRRLGG